MKRIDFTAWSLALIILTLLSFAQVTDSWAGGITSPGAARGRNSDITSLQNLHGGGMAVSNTFAGYLAGDNITGNTGYNQGVRNSIFGSGASTNTGNSNDMIVIGYGALPNCIVCTGAVVIGSGAGASIPSNIGNQGQNIVAIGNNSLSAALFTNGDVAIGNSTLNTDQGGSNTAVGSNAGATNQLQSNNLFLGYGSNLGGGGVSSGIGTGNNIIIGANSGRTLPISTINTLQISSFPTATPLISGIFDPTGGAAGSLNINGSLTANAFSAGQLVSTVATGTPPLVVTSSTAVANLTATNLSGGTVAATTISASGSSTLGGVTLAGNQLYGSVVTGVDQIKLNFNPLFFALAPTIASGFGTTPSIANSNGTAAFSVNVGTGGTASSGVIALPFAATDWNCAVVNPLTGVGTLTEQTATTSSSVTLTNFTVATDVAVAWTASYILRLNCVAK